MKEAEGVVSKDVVRGKVKLVGHGLSLRFFKVLKLIVLDREDVLDKAEICPRVVEHRVQVTHSIQDDEQGTILLL